MIKKRNVYKIMEEKMDSNPTVCKEKLITR